MEIRVSNAQELKETLIAYGIARDYQIVGCSAEELKEFENFYGNLPDSYKEIMMLLGRRAGQLVSRREFEFYIDQIREINDEYLHFLKDDLIEMNAHFSENVLIISARYGSDFEFIEANNGDDSIVYRWSAEIKQCFPSVWRWIESFIYDADEHIRRGFYL